MRTQRDHDIELAHIVQDLNHHAEQLRQRQRAGVVRDEHKHLLPREPAAQAVDQNLHDGLVGQEAGPRYPRGSFRDCLSNNHMS